MAHQEEQDGLVYTLDEALTAVGFGKFQYLVLGYAGLGSIAEAFEIMILSFIGPVLRSQWGLSSTQESLLSTVVFAGMFLGGYFWGFITDDYGRRKGLLNVTMVTAVFAALSTFSPNYISLLALRLMVGFGVGGGPVYGSWFLEFVPIQNRGMWMIVYTAFWTVGTILEALLAMVIMPRLGWRWLLALSSIPSFAALLLFVYTVESPRYLCAKGRISEASDILRKIAVINKTELPPGMLISDHVTELNEELLSPGNNKISTFKSGFSSLLTLLSPSLLKNTLLVWVISIGNAFSYYGIILLTSQFSSRHSSIALHVNNDQSLYIDVLITSLAEIPGILISAILVEKGGRKFTMALMYILDFLFLLPLLVPRLEALTTIFLFGARMFITANFNIAILYIREIYPTSVRSTGIGVSSSIGRIGAMTSPIIAVQLLSGSQMAAIISFEAVLVISATSVLLFPLETKGRELVDAFAV